MKLFEHLFLLERLDQLIRLKATGSPSELANRLGLSRRQTLRILRELREEGFPIEFDRGRQSYVYTEPVSLRFEVLVGTEHLMRG
ncbi:MAG: HTH domain-containing protein [Bacteroidetes bacterium]|jgi:predicted DNA-binding transcriptional regulator YafY|nr:HTH domain-containing protein [Bacteroidota bacterium]